MIDQSLLADIVNRHVAKGVATTFMIEAERAGEELAREIMKDRDFMDEMKGLMRAAFKRALAELQSPMESGRG